MKNDGQQLADWVAAIDSRLAVQPSLSIAQIRAIRRNFSKQLANTSPEFVVNLALQLIDGSDTTKRFLAYELVQHHRGALQSLTARRLVELGQGIASWSDVDMFACYLSGPVWREKQVSDNLVLSWAHSKDRWWRRAAIVSTVPLNTKARGGSGDAIRTLKICETLIADRDDMVVKAMSWALRALATRDPKTVRTFLRTHGTALAPRVIREVNNKLNTGLKNPH